ncbi:MAG TPA: hypothetical protein VNI83_08550 [Vicinamibacterales bacterium]|nr:hypothetical protein [Vicinamibacterales bacterium]
MSIWVVAAAGALAGIALVRRLLARRRGRRQAEISVDAVSREWLASNASRDDHLQW